MSVLLPLLRELLRSFEEERIRIDHKILLLRDVIAQQEKARA